MSGRLLSGGEEMNLLVPHNSDDAKLTPNSGALWNALDKDRYRVEVEICYWSTLGECRTLHSNSKTNSTTESRNCGANSATTFQQ